MAIISDDDFAILVCMNPSDLEADASREEILISTEDIRSWDLANVLRYSIVKIKANRKRLAEQSSYFHALLCGNFSESTCKSILIEWNLETVLRLLMCVYGCQVVITSKSLVPLLEAALYFGVEALLLKCKTWSFEVSSLKGTGLPQIQLDDLLQLWNFSLQHEVDFFPEMCVNYLSRNFMYAVSDQCFVDVPYAFLLSTLKHPHLIVDSEMHLAEAVLLWIHANSESLEFQGRAKDDYIEIFRQIRVCLLPLWFVAARRRCPFFFALANRYIQSVRCSTNSSTDLMNIEGDANLSDLTIRLTEFSEVVNLSGCPQITTAVLRQFVRKSGVDGDHLISKLVQPILTFEAVQHVDISKCHRLDIGAAIQCFSKLFPSLKVLRAAYLLNFKAMILYQLMNKCPLVCEIDLTDDFSPLIPLEVNVMSSNPETNSSSRVINNIDNVQAGPMSLISPYHSGYSSSNVTKLTLKGRTDVSDADLLVIASICASLCHVNLKGCISVTDTGISSIITKCFNLHSIIACHTRFGNNSAKALCSVVPVSLHGNKNTTSVAHKLQSLHIGGCKGVDREFLLRLMPYISSVRSLCLKECQLDNLVLSSFQGTLLESLNVSNTTISGSHLADLFLRNPGLKSLRARGCVNLIPRGTNKEVGLLSQPYFCKELYHCLGISCKLEKIALGWGFCSLALEPLRPAISSLRALTIGVGGSLGEDALRLLPTTCPLLESLTLYFQCISDHTLLHIITSLSHLRALSLCLCLGEISVFSFKSAMPCLRKLTLQRVAPSMTNDDLLILAKSCVNLIELSLLGCGLLSSDAQKIISSDWPGLISLHLEDCGEVTAEGVSSLLDCVALEDLFLRHNGRGIRRNFIVDAISKLPMLRLISLDTCDASEGGFDIPKVGDSSAIRWVRISRCEMQASSLEIQTVKTPRKRALHKDTLVVLRKGRDLMTSSSSVVVKERL